MKNLNLCHARRCRKLWVWRVRQYLGDLNWVTRFYLCDEHVAPYETCGGNFDLQSRYDEEIF